MFSSSQDLYIHHTFHFSDWSAVIPHIDAEGLSWISKISPGERREGTGKEEMIKYL
jgi:hypothetical protein